MKLIKATYEHDGKQYEAVFKPVNTGCNGCAFRDQNTSFCSGVPCDIEPYFILKEIKQEEIEE